MKHIFTFLLLCLSFNLFSQEKATTDSGKKVLLKNDGTWEYIEEKETVISNNVDCEYKTNEVDEFTKVSKLITEAKEFLTHKKGLSKKYLTCNIFFAKIDENRVLYLQWLFRTSKAYGSYGIIEEGADLILKMKDGSTLTLKAVSTDTGESNYKKNKTTYGSYYLLDKPTFELLKKSHPEKLRMYWSKGYEDYDITNPIEFSKINCIE